MNKLVKFLSYSLLALALLAPLSVQAQSRDRFAPVTYCYDSSGGSTYIGDNGDCSKGGTPGKNVPVTTTEPLYSICYNISSTGAQFKIMPDVNGKFDCPTDYPTVKLCPAYGGPAAMCLDKPKPPTPTPTPTPKPGGGTTTGGGSTAASTPCNPPEEGFHLVGGLCVPSSPFDSNSIAGGGGSVTELAVKVIRFMLYFAGIVAVIMIIIGGYLYMTAGGNTAQAGNGRKTLINALIGLALTVLAYVIVQVVYSFLTSG